MMAQGMIYPLDIKNRLLAKNKAKGIVSNQQFIFHYFFKTHYFFWLSFSSFNTVFFRLTHSKKAYVL